MKKAKVFFAAISDDDSIETIAQKTLKVAQAAGLEQVVQKGRSCAIKTHFGERNNLGYVKPPVARAVVDFVKKAGGRPFVTDTNTLYRGRRSQAVDHIEMAAEHGFTLESLGAPVIIADGLHGADQVSVAIDGGKRFKEVRIASGLYQAGSTIVLTHVKGHCQLGLGGSIKNVGMGCAARAGKMAQHQGGQPKFDKAKCTACGTCVRWCPVDAIVLEKKAKLIPEKCIGCGECLALCPFDAIGFDWLIGDRALIENVCEHVLGFLSNKPGAVGYLNLVTFLTRNCDCMGKGEKAEYPNVGVLASTDIVAVDKASADLTEQRFETDIWAAWWPESGYETQFSYGEQLGLGTSNYDLITVS